ncbi:MAG: thiol-disulfide oxidoreductase DCC family protein [Gammaproteobacteria bacterium]
MLKNPNIASQHEGTAPQLTVYYDAACPQCRRDRKSYEKLLGDTSAEQVCWFDITGQDRHLREQGIDPEKALTELHVRDAEGNIASELDAYILLMNKVPRLKPIAWLIGLPLIRPLLAKLYHWQVNRRLRNRIYRSS